MTKTPKPLMTYEVKRKYSDDLYLACRIPIVPKNRMPYRRLCATFPNSFTEDQIHESRDGSCSISINNRIAIIGEWILVDHIWGELREIMRHEDFLHNFEGEDFEDLLEDQGIIRDSEIFKLAVRVPVTSWMQGGDLDWVLRLLKKNGGKVEIHNHRNERKLRVPYSRTVMKELGSQGTQLMEGPFIIAFPRDWIVIDYAGNTGVFNDDELDKLRKVEDNKPKSEL